MNLFGVGWRGWFSTHKLLMWTARLVFFPGIFSFTRCVVRHLGLLEKYQRLHVSMLYVLEFVVARCFGWDVLVFSRVYDAFEFITIQELHRFLRGAFLFWVQDYPTLFRGSKFIPYYVQSLVDQTSVVSLFSRIAPFWRGFQFFWRDCFVVASYVLGILSLP